MQVTVEQVDALWFGPGDPVRAASAVAPFGDGWLIVQDDATHAAWWRPTAGSVDRVRLFPPVEGHEVFSEAAGTKHLKPDAEAACPVRVGVGVGVLLLGSGSLPARTGAAILIQGAHGIEVHTADLSGLYAQVRATLGVAADQLNLEGACVVGSTLRWFQRGHGRSGVPSASVDLECDAVVTAVLDQADGADIRPGAVRRHHLGELDGQPLGITDAVALPDGRVLVSAAAEDSADPVADGPVAGSVLALLDGGAPTTGRVPEVGGVPVKVEGLAVVDAAGGVVRLLAVADQDDPAVPSLAMALVVAPG